MYVHKCIGIMIIMSNGYTDDNHINNHNYHKNDVIQSDELRIKMYDYYNNGQYDNYS